MTRPAISFDLARPYSFLKALTYCAPSVRAWDRFNPSSEWRPEPSGDFRDQMIATSLKLVTERQWNGADEHFRDQMIAALLK